ncbi:NAD(P)/FAD-dependent oxidoreductase [Rhodococcus sp. NPDC003382]|uniref:NAD(P)/FAD-dependent oxidoreductase n=1 Tax=Rhodococcus sp. HM1 TaxID=2937759 RepID=UPI00200AE8D8|nr:FAD-dependent oxidoreductase [Rhodococcus sp. HM1]MCK8674632.1 FAD-dependent oxidoreductase [Rhodococcus sp. HM1]
MRVVVVGAGYAGTIAANRLAKKVPDAEITIVNDRPEFVERVRLHQQTAGTGGAATPLSSMLRKGIAFRLGSAVKIGGNQVVLADGEQLGFDYAVIATGGSVHPIPGSIPVGTWEGARIAEARLAGLQDGGDAVVVGGGLTGIETASEIARSRKGLKVRLVADEFAAGLSEGARRKVRKSLEKAGVEILADRIVGISQGQGRDVVRLASGSAFETDVTLWAVISGVSDFVAQSGLAVDERGRALVDRFLRSEGSPNVFVVGDCAAVPGARPSCATASPQGAHTADNLQRISRGKDLAPYSMGYVGQAVGLGGMNALMQLVRSDDSPRNLYFSGFFAGVTKEIVSRYAKFGSRTAIYVWRKGRI